MKKSTIWLLIIVMALTFGGLIYVQILYMEKMTRMRNEQFNENVKRSLSDVAGYLERQETLHYLEEDIEDIEAAFYDDYSLALATDTLSGQNIVSPIFMPAAVGVEGQYKQYQKIIRNQYLYQKGLLNEVILNIMREASRRPALERGDTSVVRKQLQQELSSCGINLPFEFSMFTTKKVICHTKDFPVGQESDVYSQMLFQGSPMHYYLNVYFPTKGDYIYNSVRFLIPTLSFTLILLIVFLYTVILAFRQKRITEMKNDFINNMTHEFKTPISTISLAAQMLADDSVRKSPSMLQHLSTVITDESKRLRFQVEKVLQMSMFDRQQPNLKFSEVDVNRLIEQVVSTFKIKVEKYGGSLNMNLQASKDKVLVDEMHLTNVIFNLLDNAVKYVRQDAEPRLEISTTDLPDNKLEIRVKDNGIGIKKEHLKLIFDKFYRVPTGNNHDVKGFGLGLAYVHKLITEFGGQIKVESDFGKGTTFIITLPLTP